MARTAQINYKRITFSFPAEVAERLRIEIGQSNMSKYVVNLIENDLDGWDKSSEKIFQRFDDFGKNLKFRTDKSSLEILREIRHG